MKRCNVNLFACPAIDISVGTSNPRSLKFVSKPAKSPVLVMPEFASLEEVLNDSIWDKFFNNLLRYFTNKHFRVQEVKDFCKNYQ